MHLIRFDGRNFFEFLIKEQHVLLLLPPPDVAAWPSTIHGYDNRLAESAACLLMRPS